MKSTMKSTASAAAAVVYTLIAGVLAARTRSTTCAIVHDDMSARVHITAAVVRLRISTVLATAIPNNEFLKYSDWKVIGWSRVETSQPYDFHSRHTERSIFTTGFQKCESVDFFSRFKLVGLSEMTLDCLLSSS